MASNPVPDPPETPLVEVPCEALLLTLTGSAEIGRAVNAADRALHEAMQRLNHYVETEGADIQPGAETFVAQYEQRVRWFMLVVDQRKVERDIAWQRYVQALHEEHLEANDKTAKSIRHATWVMAGATILYVILTAIQMARTPVVPPGDQHPRDGRGRSHAALEQGCR